jgi:DNA repair protein RAD7
MTEESIAYLGTLTSLEHLTLAVVPETSSATLVSLVTSLGPNLRTLCLENFQDLDDAVIDAVQQHCPKLYKLRITGSSTCHDSAFASLFGNNSPFPPLVCADLSENRDIDSMNPEGSEDDVIGFGSLSLPALLTHSATRLERLNLKSDRHISHATLLDCFDGIKQYPALKDIDLSFVSAVDDVVVAGIFKSCPNLSKLAVFACFNARGAPIPRGIAVVGLPNAGDNILQGDYDGM